MTKISLLKKLITKLRQLVLLYKELIEAKKKKYGYQKEPIKEMIERIAIQCEINPDFAIRVAFCESGLNPLARRVNRNGTIDRGLYQWNDYWHPEVTDEEAYDASTATHLFCKAVKEGHLSWWNASRTCWRR